MITCDICGTKNKPDEKLFVNDVIANISICSGHWNPPKNEKTASDTRHVFRGQACTKCFEKLAVALKHWVDEAISKGGA